MAVRTFLPGRRYRHISTSDIDMVAKGRFYPGTDYLTGKFIYVNRHNGIVYNPQGERVKVMKADLDKWDQVYDQQDNPND